MIALHSASALTNEKLLVAGGVDITTLGYFFITKLFVTDLDPSFVYLLFY
jgi:hypothetical protein